MLFGCIVTRFEAKEVFQSQLKSNQWKHLCLQECVSLVTYQHSRYISRMISSRPLSNSVVGRVFPGFRVR